MSATGNNITVEHHLSGGATHAYFIPDDSNGGEVPRDAAEEAAIQKYGYPENIIWTSANRYLLGGSGAERLGWLVEITHN